MLRTGAIVLSVWSGLNLLFAAACNVAILCFHQNSPGLTFMVNESEIRQLAPHWLTGINGLAVLCNAFDAAFCLLALFVIWGGMARQSRCAFWGLLLALGSLQVSLFVGYAIFGGLKLREGAAAANLLANVGSSAVLLVGLGLSGYAIYRRP